MNLILYVPVLHRGYIELFRRYVGKNCSLYILSDDIIGQFPLTAREIRSIDTDTVYKMIKTLGIFTDVKIAGENIIKKLARQTDQPVILSNDLISDTLYERYFTNHKVIRETVFLRFDENTVKTARQEVEFVGQISKDKFQREIFSKLANEKEKSSDWFLKVGAAVILDDKAIVVGHNRRQPTIHSPWIIGDPRNFLEYGTNSGQRSALHAEQSVIAECARLGIATDQADFYVTTFPCPDCASLVASTGVKRLFFQDGFSQLSSRDIFETNNIEIIKVI